MSSLFDNIWEDEQPVRLPDPPPKPPAWLGNACVWGPAQTQGSKRGFVHPHLKRVVIVDDNDKALEVMATGVGGGHAAYQAATGRRYEWQ